VNTRTLACEMGITKLTSQLLEDVSGPCIFAVGRLKWIYVGLMAHMCKTNRITHTRHHCHPLFDTDPFVAYLVEEPSLNPEMKDLACSHMRLFHWLSASKRPSPVESMTVPMLWYSGVSSTICLK